MLTSPANLILADDNLMLLASFFMAALVLLAATLALHALDLHAGLRKLAAALERDAVDAFAPRLLPEGGARPVARLARAINAGRRRLAEREAEYLDTQAAYAHDLRTPITRMGLRCEMLDDAELREAMAHDLAEMAELVDATMASAQARRGASAQLRPVDADYLLGTLVGNYRTTGREVALEGAVGQPVVACPLALRRVLTNLIDNALRYGEQVRLCVRVEAGRVVLAVVDAGPGIAPAQLEAVFAPWYRAPETATRASGNGLGLAIARRLAVSMHGELQLENRRSGGLEARLALPLAAA